MVRSLAVDDLPALDISDIPRDLRRASTELKLEIATPDGVLVHQVQIEKTDQHIGERVWFVCPCCSSRCRVLRFRRGKSCCRSCLGLTYASQRA
ncbi:MAG: hypothetical protein AAF627_09905 [Myxococcota bacterium]